MPRMFSRGEWVRFGGRTAKVLHPGIVDTATGKLLYLVAYREGPDIVQELWVPEDSLKKMPPEERAAMALGASGEDWECPEEG